MQYSELSMPLGSSEASLFRQSRFWIAQVAGWLLIKPLYLRGEVDGAFREGQGESLVILIATSCAMAIACSSALATVYLWIPPRWLTGVRVIPIAIGLSLLAALPWATVMTLVVADTTSVLLAWRQYGSWLFFHTSLLMAVWSGAFLWFIGSQRAQKSQAGLLPSGEFAPEGERSDGNEAGLVRAGGEGAMPSSAAESVAVPWRPDERVRLREGKSSKSCRIRDIAYIRAADDYTEVHLCNGEVVMVRQRLRYWELRLPETFVRIHRSTIVNLELSEEMVRLEGVWRVRLRGCSEPLTVSRRLVRALRAKVDGRQRRLSI